jgi:hypothetical protein
VRATVVYLERTQRYWLAGRYVNWIPTYALAILSMVPLTQILAGLSAGDIHLHSLTRKKATPLSASMAELASLRSSSSTQKCLRDPAMGGRGSTFFGSSHLNHAPIPARRQTDHQVSRAVHLHAGFRSSLHLQRWRCSRRLTTGYMSPCSTTMTSVPSSAAAYTWPSSPAGDSMGMLRTMIGMVVTTMISDQAYHNHDVHQAQPYSRGYSRRPRELTIQLGEAGHAPRWGQCGAVTLLHQFLLDKSNPTRAG